MTQDGVLKIVDVHGGSITWYPLVEFGALPIVVELVREGCLNKNESGDDVVISLTDKGRDRIKEYLDRKMTRGEVLVYIESGGGQVEWTPFVENGSLSVVKELANEGLVELHIHDDCATVELTAKGKEEVSGPDNTHKD
ncbi:MAG: hypothetical protein AAF483_11200 [Planctomycetota bacterium]